MGSLIQAAYIAQMTQKAPTVVTVPNTSAVTIIELDIEITVSNDDRIGLRSQSLPFHFHRFSPCNSQQMM